MTPRRRLETWKAIASHVGRSERWCRYQSRRGVDALPAGKIGGVVAVWIDELDAWLAREMARAPEQRIPPPHAWRPQ
jgi:hypothetical protein